MLVTEKTLQRERYRVVHQFGHDGKVYEAYDNILKTHVVLKEISGTALKSPAQMQAQKSAFVNEAKILTTISHESLPHVHDYFSETDNNYLVMELVDGNDLGTLLETNKKPFSFGEVALWADQLLDALSYLHKHSPPIIHRAVKPQNIKLTEDGKIKLLAFGDTDVSAAEVSAAFMNQNSNAADLSYLPLEQIWKGLDPASRKVILNSYDEKSERILEQPADARTDVYSIGATIYHLLTGQTPADALARSIDILDDKPDPLTPPKEINKALPDSISNVILRAMAIKREERFDSAVIMRQVLRTALVKIKEQKAEEAERLKAEAAENLKLAEQKRLEQERLTVEQKRLELEAEQKRLEQEHRIVEQKKQELEAEKRRQSELINEQLREAEAKKLLAEQLAAEAEKSLLEKQNRDAAGKFYVPLSNDILELAEPEIFEAMPEPQPGPQTDLPASKKDFEAEKRFVPRGSLSGDSGDLFTATPKNGQTFRRMAAVAGALGVLCAAVLGIRFFTSSPPAENNQAISGSTMSVSETAKPAPTEESVETPEVTNTTFEPAAAPPTVSNSPVAIPAAPAAVKTKAVSVNPNVPTRVQNQTVPATKPVADQTKPKKPVTVDDLINDN